LIASVAALRVCAAAGLVLLAIALVDSPAAEGATVVPVVPCPVPAQRLPAAIKPPPIPPTVSLPAGSSPPPGTALYGTTVAPGFGVFYSLAPRAFRCEPSFASADGGLTVDLSDPSDTKRKVSMVFLAGGLGPALQLSCSYIPEIKNLAEARRFGCPAAPTGDSIVQLPTGSHSLLAAVVEVPAGVADPHVPSSGTGQDTTFAAFTGNTDLTSRAGPQMIECTLSATQREVCATALAFFMDHSTVGQQLDPSALIDVDTAIRNFVASPTTPPSPGGPSHPEPTSGEKECDPFSEAQINVDPPWVRKLDDTLKERTRKAAARVFPVSVAKLAGRLPVAIEATPSIDMGVASFCASGLRSGGLGGESNPWDENQDGDHVLSIQAEEAANVLGFTYSATDTQWIEPPNLPEQESVTKFDPHPRFVPGFDLTFSDKPLDVSLVLFSVDFVSFKHNAKLVSHGTDVLTAGLQPSLAFQVEVSKKDLVDNLGEKINETGGDVEEAERLAADQAEKDIVATADVEGEGFYGMSAEQIERKLESQIDQRLTEAFKAEIDSLGSGTAEAAADTAEFSSVGAVTDEVPALAAEAPGAVTADAVGADAAGAFGAEAGGIEAKIACDMMLGGPEDLFGDALCLFA
jgi:hypothetical protein